MCCVGDTVLQLAFCRTPLRPFSFSLHCVHTHATKAESDGLSPFGQASAGMGGLWSGLPSANCELAAAISNTRCEVHMYLPCSHCTFPDLSTNLPIRRRPGTHGLVYYCPGLPFLALALFSCFFKATTTRLFSHLTFHRESHLLSQKIIRSSSAILPTALLPDKPRLRSKAVQYKAAHCFRHL
jgi:hypothetical protein